MSFWGNLVTTVAGPLVGGLTSLFGGKQAADSQANTNQKQIELAQQQRDWEERMSNTAYQRSRDDMTKAGLNPILMAKMGGASTPVYQQASLENPGQYYAQAGTNAFQSALNAMSMKQQIALQKSQEKVNSAVAAKELENAKAQKGENIRSGTEGLLESEGKAKTGKTLWYRGLNEIKRVLDSVIPLRGLFKTK